MLSRVILYISIGLRNIINQINTMAKYRLVYISTRNFNGSNIPVDEFEPVPLDHVTEDYNEADRMRCELCAVMNFGYVKIVEE